MIWLPDFEPFDERPPARLTQWAKTLGRKLGPASPSRPAGNGTPAPSGAAIPAVSESVPPGHHLRFTLICRGCGQTARGMTVLAAWTWYQAHRTVRLMSDDTYDSLVAEVVADAEEIIV